MDKYKKIKEISEIELTSFVNLKYAQLMRDLKQNFTPDEQMYDVMRIIEILAQYQFLTIYEFENVLEIGMTTGFGKFKKLSVQVISEWLKNRQREIFEKQQAKEKNEKIQSNKLTARSPLGKVMLIKFNMYHKRMISESVYDAFPVKKLYELSLQGQSVKDILMDAENNKDLDFEMENF